MDRGGAAPSGCGLNCLVARKERLGALQFYNNVYKDGTTTKVEADKKTETTSQPTGTTQPTGGAVSDAVSNGVKDATRSATEVFFLNAGAGFTSIAGDQLAQLLGHQDGEIEKQ
jgi:hypothetical protein